jgi:Zn ribbon nucleic-acid-binding protein
MPKGKGGKCPACGEESFHEKGSFRLCSNCDFIGWEANHPVKANAWGSGSKCPQCGNKTVQGMFVINKHEVSRCSTCQYVAFYPTKKSGIKEL